MSSFWTSVRMDEHHTCCISADVARVLLKTVFIFGRVVFIFGQKSQMAVQCIYCLFSLPYSRF